METAILILQDALNQQKEQLKRTIDNSKNAKNDKQVVLYDKAINNLNSFIAELEEAINILKPNELQSVSNNEHEGNSGIKLKCGTCGYTNSFIPECVECGNKL